MSDTTRASGALLFFLTLGFLALLVHGRVFGAGNDASRFALIESLVDFGADADRGLALHWTIDRVTIAGQDYSNKPPLPVTFRGGDLRGDQRRHRTDLRAQRGRRPLSPEPAARGPADRLAGRRLPPLAPAVLAPASTAVARDAGAGGRDDPHLVLHDIEQPHRRAALLFAACEAAWSGNAMTAGCHIALLACIDTVPGLVFAPVLGLIVRDTAGARGLRRFAGALAAGAALFVAANLWVVDSPWPPKMVPGALDYSSSTGPELAGVLLPTSWTYPLSALFGWHGFFTVSPVLLFGAAGMARAALEGRPLPRCWIVLLAAACGLMIAVTCCSSAPSAAGRTASAT